MVKSKILNKRLMIKQFQAGKEMVLDSLHLNGQKT